MTAPDNPRPLPIFLHSPSGSIPSPPSKKTPPSRTTTEPNLIQATVIVQASASQGDEVALFHALSSTWTVNLLIVSPRFRGSNPYPCGSLTYRPCVILCLINNDVNVFLKYAFCFYAFYVSVQRWGARGMAICMRWIERLRLPDKKSQTW